MTIVVRHRHCSGEGRKRACLGENVVQPSLHSSTHGPEIEDRTPHTIITLHSFEIFVSLIKVSNAYQSNLCPSFLFNLSPHAI